MRVQPTPGSGCLAQDRSTGAADARVRQLISALHIEHTRHMRYGDLTFREIQHKAAAGWLAVVPTGCTEQQGPHLPVDFDTWFAETLMLAAAKHAAEHYDVRALVLPALPFGPTPEHCNFGGGYIDVPVAIHTALVHAVLVSLATQGFQRIVVWRGCGGHDLRNVTSEFNMEYVGQARAFLPEAPYHSIWCRIGDPTVLGGHADSFTTSIALYLRPEAVRADQIVDPQNALVDWGDPELDFTRYSTTGVIGDPTHASPALGARLWTEVMEAAAQVLREVASS
jgi:creatinine amidohydrolase